MACRFCQISSCLSKIKIRQTSELPNQSQQNAVAGLISRRVTLYILPYEFLLICLAGKEQKKLAVPLHCNAATGHFKSGREVEKHRVWSCNGQRGKDPLPLCLICRSSEKSKVRQFLGCCTADWQTNNCRPKNKQFVT